VATNNRQESPYICMAMRLWEAAEPTNTRASAAHASATRTRLGPANQHPSSHVSNLLPAAGGHRPPSRASSPAAATQCARAGRAPAGHHSRTGSWPFLHSPNATPPLEPTGAWTRAPTASTVPSGARCSYFLVEKAAYRGRESVTTRCTIWRKSRHRLRTPAAQQHRGQ